MFGNQKLCLIALAVVLRLQLVSAQSLGVSPTQLSFTSVADSSTPFAPQALQLTSTGANVPFALVAAGLTPWVYPSTGMTPATIIVAPPVGAALFGTTNVPLSFFVPGTPITSGTESTATITFTPPPPPVASAVVDATSFLPGPISPGQFVAIFGENIGPLFDMTKLLQTGPLIQFPALSGGTLVLVNKSNGALINYAPVLYAAKGQVNFIVPMEVAGQSSVIIQLTHYGAPAPPITLPVTDTTPEIFSANGQGIGPGAILNTNSTLNSAANPAPKGSIVQIFAEGAGLFTPSLSDGELANGLTVPFTPIAPVSLKIGGQPAQVLYAGQAPNLVAGVLQVNAMIPQNVSSGAQPVVLTVGSNSNSSQGITVAVQ